MHPLGWNRRRLSFGVEQMEIRQWTVRKPGREQNKGSPLRMIDHNGSTWLVVSIRRYLIYRIRVQYGKGVGCLTEGEPLVMGASNAEDTVTSLLFGGITEAVAVPYGGNNRMQVAIPFRPILIPIPPLLSYPLACACASCLPVPVPPPRRRRPTVPSSVTPPSVPLDLVTSISTPHRDAPLHLPRTSSLTFTWAWRGRSAGDAKVSVRLTPFPARNIIITSVHLVSPVCLSTCLRILVSLTDT